MPDTPGYLIVHIPADEFRCDSYNTAQIRLLRGDILDAVGQNGNSGNISDSRFRPSAYSANQGTSPQTLESLQMSMGSVPGTSLYSRLNAPPTNEANARSSYSLTRGRAVSPVVSNYFGLPPDRETPRSRSLCTSGNRNKSDDRESNGDGLRLWGKTLKYTYGFLGETEPLSGSLKPDDEENDGGMLTDDETVEEEVVEEEEEQDDNDELDDDDDEDDEDDEDDIDVYGHR